MQGVGGGGRPALPASPARVCAGVAGCGTVIVGFGRGLSARGGWVGGERGDAVSRVLGSCCLLPLSPQSQAVRSRQTVLRGRWVMEPLNESFPAGRPGTDLEMGILLEPLVSSRKAPEKTGWEILPSVAFPPERIPRWGRL